ARIVVILRPTTPHSSHPPVRAEVAGREKTSQGSPAQFLACLAYVLSVFSAQSGLVCQSCAFPLAFSLTAKCHGLYADRHLLRVRNFCAAVVGFLVRPRSPDGKRGEVCKSLPPLL